MMSSSTIQASGAATKTETCATLIPGGRATGSSFVASEQGGASAVQFVLRQCSALSAKPKGPPSTSAPSTTPSAVPAPAAGFPSHLPPPPAKQPWRNPFLPYEEDLWVQHLSPTHTLLLNKVRPSCEGCAVRHHDFIPPLISAWPGPSYDTSSVPHR